MVDSTSTRLRQSPVDSVAFAARQSEREATRPGVLDSNWTQIFGVNLLDGTNYLDTVSAFIEGFLHLLAGEGVWGRGRHLSPFPQKSFRNLPAVLFVLKKHHRCASRFGWT